MWHRTVGCIITLTLSILVAPLVAEAQPTGKVYRLGWLSEGVRPDEPSILEALRMLGYVEGHNLVVERRYATQGEPLPALAALVTRQVDLILTNGTQATQAVHQATTTMPKARRMRHPTVRRSMGVSWVRGAVPTIPTLYHGG